MSQIDLFGTATTPPSDDDPLMGQQVRMPERCQCGSVIARIGPGTATHRASVRCSSCNRHRAWLSKKTAAWLEAVAQKFGAPEVITLRTKNSTDSRG